MFTVKKLIMMIRLLAICLMVRTADTIVVPVEFQRIEDPANRELINPDTELAQIEVRELSKTVNCLTSFVEMHMDQLPTRISVLLMKADDPVVSSVYLSKLQKVRTTYTLTGDLEQTSDHNSSLDALVLLSSYEQLDNSTSRLIDLCGRDCRYGVVITSLYPDEESFMAEAEDFVELLWKKSVANVVIFGTVGGTLLAAQSQEFRPDERIRPERPILIARCQNDRWINQAKVFPAMKLNNCEVHFACISNQPYIDVTGANDSLMITGIEAEIVSILAKHLGFKLKPSTVEWGVGTTLEEEVEEEFVYGESIDLVVGGIHWTPINGADFALPYDVVEIVWLVPATSNISFLGLIAPLSPNIWFLTIASIFFGGILKLLFFHKMSFLEIFSLVIGVAWHKQPARVSYRIKFISWVVFGYVLTQVYLASLAGQLLASADHQVDSMDELVNSGLSFGGTASHKTLFEPDNSTGEVVRRIYENFVVFEHDNYEVKWEDLIHGENSSLALVVVLNISSMGSTFNRRNVHALRETLARFPLTFPTWKGLPYLTQIDLTLEGLIQGGVIAYIAKNASSFAHLHHDDDNEESVNLALPDLAPSFLLLVIGHSFAILCLLAECAVARCLRGKRAKKLEVKREMKTLKAKKLEKKSIKKVRFDENKLKWIEPSYELRSRVIRPNITIGYYDHATMPWKVA